MLVYYYYSHFVQPYLSVIYSQYSSNAPRQKSGFTCTTKHYLICATVLSSINALKILLFCFQGSQEVTHHDTALCAKETRLPT